MVETRGGRREPALSFRERAIVGEGEAVPSESRVRNLANDR